MLGLALLALAAGAASPLLTSGGRRGVPTADQRP
eukprot:SAG31_NODE_26853_length_435_cov_1.014881_1_plen_33_part_10